jgi:hypothetical protein
MHTFLVTRYVTGYNAFPGVHFWRIRGNYSDFFFLDKYLLMTSIAMVYGRCSTVGKDTGYGLDDPEVENMYFSM